MAAADVSQIPEDVPPVAAFATADGNYLLRVYALNTTGLEDYLNLLQGQGAANFKNVTVNGIDCVGCENEANNFDILIVPITETQVLAYVFTPLNGDDGWDETKVAMVSSVQVAQ